MRRSTRAPAHGEIMHCVFLSHKDYSHPRILVKVAEYMVIDEEMLALNQQRAEFSEQASDLNFDLANDAAGHLSEAEYDMRLNRIDRVIREVLRCAEKIDQLSCRQREIRNEIWQISIEVSKTRSGDRG